MPFGPSLAWPSSLRRGPFESGSFDEPGPQSIRGRGLPIVQALVDLVAVERRNGQTKVVATRRLTPHPA